MKNSEMSKWFIFFAILAALMLAMSPCVVMAGEGKEPPAGVKYTGPPAKASAMGELGVDPLDPEELVAFIWGTLTNVKAKQTVEIAEENALVLPRDQAVTFDTLSAKDLKGYEFQDVFGDGKNYLSWTAHSLVKWMDGERQMFSAEVLLLEEQMTQ